MNWRLSGSICYKIIFFAGTDCKSALSGITVLGFDGYGRYGKGKIVGVIKEFQKYYVKGEVVIFKNGGEVNRQLYKEFNTLNILK